MPAQERLGGDMPENVIDRIDDTLVQFFLDTKTIRAVEVESLPLIIDTEEEGAALAISFSHMAEYAGNDPYRCVVAEIDCGLVDSSEVDAIREKGAVWWNDTTLKGEGGFQSIREFDGDNVDFELVVRRDEDKKEGGDVSVVSTDSLMKTVSAIEFPGARRIGSLLSSIIEAPKRYDTSPLTRSQSDSDFRAVSSFIRNLGIGRVSVSNFVPVHGPEDFEAHFAEIDQVRLFDPKTASPLIDLRSQIPYDLEISFNDYSYSLKKNIFPLRQNRGLVELSKQRSETLTRLDNGVEMQSSGRPDLYNIPLTQAHIRQLLGRYTTAAK